MTSRRLWSTLKRTGAQWLEHKSPKAGASLAYYSIFSMGPLIVVVMSIASLIFQRQGVQEEVTSAIRGLVGDKGAEAVAAMLAGAGKPSEGLIAASIGVATLLFAAVGVVVQLKEALNVVWETRPPTRSGVWPFVREYILSFAAVLALGFLMMVSMLVTAGLAAVGKHMGGLLPEPLMQAAGFTLSFLTIALLFALLFKWMPDADVQWRDVIWGAIGTAALFEIGKFAIGFYIGKQGLESTYGASSSIVVLLIWVYYSAQILLFGAEFTHAWAERRNMPAPREGLRSGRKHDAPAIAPSR